MIKAEVIRSCSPLLFLLVVLFFYEKGHAETQFNKAEQQQTIRMFVNYNYRFLVIDIVNEQGIYLSSLITLLNKPNINQHILIESLKQLLIENIEVGDFARAVADMYLENS